MIYEEILLKPVMAALELFLMYMKKPIGIIILYGWQSKKIKVKI